MITLENIGAIDRVRARYLNLVDPDATPLMVSWQRIIRDDNRKGVLAGTDKDGAPMAPVTYRPIQSDRINIRSKSAAALRHGQHASRMRDLVFAGFGDHASGLNNNLTPDQYRRLDGPPLAPRRQFSRVISNLLTAYGRLGTTQWTAWGYWDEVVDKTGQPFLHYHFEGGAHLPRRDLRGVRPEGVERARNAARAWMIDTVRTNQ